MNSSGKGAYLLALPWELSVVGGVNQVVLNLYRQFDASGMLEPRILINDWAASQPVEETDASSGARVIRMRVRPPFKERGWLLAQFARYLLTFPSEMRKLGAMVRRYDVRVVNCHFIGADAIGWAFAKATGQFRGKLLYSLHGLDIRTLARTTGIRHAIWRYALESADAVIACSDGLARETIDAFGLTGRNVITIHNGVQAERLQKLAGGESKEVVAHERRNLVNLGTFEHKKGHDLLLQAFKLVLQQYPDARLSILGRSAGELEKTRALLDELGLSGNVRIEADVPHHRALSELRDAEVFVLPSRNEAFSVALLEAGAMGKPVVATSVCGVPELISNRLTGLLVPPEDIGAFADGIVSMLRDPESARAYGQNLQRLVLKEFTAEMTYQRYFRLVS